MKGNCTLGDQRHGYPLPINLQVAGANVLRHIHPMTITLPDDPALQDFTEEDIRLDLACALFAAGRISRPIAARMAGLERHEMDKELFSRKISGFTQETLEADLATLATLFPG